MPITRYPVPVSTADVPVSFNSTLEIALLALGDTAKPAALAENLSTAAGATLSDTTPTDITIDAPLVQPIPRGNIIYWNAPAPSTEVVRVQMFANAAIGATTLSVAPDPTAPTIATGATASWTAFYELCNITSSNPVFGTDTEQLITYKTTGGVVATRPIGLSASIEVEGYLTWLDPGEITLDWAARNSVSGVEVWVVHTGPVPVGGTIGQVTEGRAVLSDGFTPSQAAREIPTFTTTLTFQDAPEVTNAY